jgi:hypothetical protein
MAKKARKKTKKATKRKTVKKTSKTTAKKSAPKKAATRSTNQSVTLIDHANDREYVMPVMSGSIGPDVFHIRSRLHLYRQL